MRTIDKIITQVHSRFGTPMGRMNIGDIEAEDIKVYDCAVRMNGAYDYGGAYWGLSEEQLRVRYTKDLSYIKFYRLNKTTKALAFLIDHYSKSIKELLKEKFNLHSTVQRTLEITEFLSKRKIQYGVCYCYLKKFYVEISDLKFVKKNINESLDVFQQGYWIEVPAFNVYSKKKILFLLKTRLSILKKEFSYIH